MLQMRPEIRQRWVAALRSGEYRQGRFNLARRDDGKAVYCCLGVLCKLAEEDGVAYEHEPLSTTPENSVIMEFRPVDPQYPSLTTGQTEELPQEVVAWAGLNRDDPLVNGIRLSHLNDRDGYTFDQIADIIEAKNPPLKLPT